MTTSRECFRKALERWGKSEPQVAAALKYLDSGDLRHLKQSRPGRNSMDWWIGDIARALPEPGAWTLDDRRAVHVLCSAEPYAEYLGARLTKLLAERPASEEIVPLVRAEALAGGMTSEQFVNWVFAHVVNWDKDGQDTSAGRFLAAADDKTARNMLKRICAASGSEEAFKHLLKKDPSRADWVFEEALELGDDGNEVLDLAVGHAGKHYETRILKAFQNAKLVERRFKLATLLLLIDPKAHRDSALAAGRAAVEASDELMEVWWLAENFGKSVLPDVLRHFSKPLDKHIWNLDRTFLGVVAALKDDAPHLLAHVIREGDPRLKFPAVEHLAQGHLATHRAAIIEGIKAGFALSASDLVAPFLGLAGRLALPELESELWRLFEHKSKPVRDAACRAMSKRGEAAIPKATALLEHRKADARRSAAALLAAIGTQEALGTLEKQVEQEADDDVRDVIVEALDRARQSSGKSLSRADFNKRIARSSANTKTPPAKWVDPDKLPRLKYTSGKTVEAEVVRYMLYRQSRVKEIRPDVEARGLYALVDRTSSGDFALELLDGFLRSGAQAGDRWALTLAAVFGDDRMVPVVNRQIREWAENSRGKIAEYAVQALALLGTQSALLAVDAMSIRYRSKLRNIGAAATAALEGAAELLGISREELGDRIVPWLEFEGDKPLSLDCGERTIEAVIGVGMKLVFRDPATKKPIASLPKSCPKETAARMKALGANVREAVKSQLLRMENLLVKQRRWSPARWKELFLTHPLLLPFAIRLVWAAYDSNGTITSTYRALEDRTLTGADEESLTLPASGSIGMVHPLEIDPAALASWREHLADHEIEAPFPQLDRPVAKVTAEQAAFKVCKTWNGTTLNALSFRGRAERLGWVRGSVQDAGMVADYWKSFPEAGVDAFLDVEGLFMGAGMDDSVTLGDLTFVKSGSVKTGSYVYDAPGPDEDRTLAFGEVHPVAYSEVMGDVERIAAKSAAVETS